MPPCKIGKIFLGLTLVVLGVVYIYVPKQISEQNIPRLKSMKRFVVDALVKQIIQLGRCLFFINIHILPALNE